jgi:heptosyltransferase-2
MGRILVIRGGALGDFILTLPVLAALRTTFPDARIEVLGYPHIARLALAGGHAHAVHAIEARPLAGFFARNGTLDPGMAGFFAGFTVIVSFLYDPDGIFQANVARSTKAQFITGPHRPDESAPVHATDAFLTALQRLAIFEANAAPTLTVAPSHPGPGCWIAAHPGSGSESKNWPEAHWAELLDRIARRSKANILLVGGEAEGSRLERLAGALPASRTRVARNQPLDDLARLLRGCSTFVGHDSGITHLAASVGLPGTALWGPSNHVVWAPRSPRIRILHAPEGLATLAIQPVWEQVQASLPTPAGSAPTA